MYITVVAMSEKLTEKQQKTLESFLDSKLEIITDKLCEIDRKVEDASKSLSFLSNKVDDALIMSNILVGNSSMKVGILEHAHRPIYSVRTSHTISGTHTHI